jgi:hypothetical protein
VTSGANQPKERVQEALDESRILILGAQIFLGLLYRAVFEPGYDAFPRLSQYLVVVALALIVIAFTLLTWPVAYHRIVDQGTDSADFEIFVMTVMKLALPVFGASLMLTLYVAADKVTAHAVSILMALAAASAALIWLAGGVHRLRNNRKQMHKMDKIIENRSGGDAASLDDKIKHVLTEARMVLPGAQALLGFQFVTMVLDDFDKLPMSSKVVHLISLMLTSLSVTLLMTPAAHHRIVEKGANTEDFHRFASRILLIAMAPLALGIAGDFFVVVRKVTASVAIAAGSAALVLGMSYGMWFGFTLYRRIRLSAVTTQ